MKHALFVLTFLASFSSTVIHAAEQSLEEYLLGYDYAARKEMKANSETLAEMLTKGEAQLIDIRFKEEYEAWHMGVARNIPLPELPKRLNEIDKSKVIVTACPHKDRAIIAMIYLKTQGYNAKYLVDGLTGFAEYLRGDMARDYIESLPG